MFILNPPRRRRRKKAKAARSKRKRVTRRRKKPMASRTRRRRAKRSRSGRFVKKGGGRRRRRARPAARRRRRRSSARRAAPRRRRRRAAASRSGARRSRRLGGRIRRPRVHYKRGRYYSRGILHGVRVNPRRRRRYGRRRMRSNPFSMPTLSSVTGVLKTGAAVGVGWVGVNAVLMIADKIGLAKLKASQSPTVAALINAGVRVIATPIVARLASRFLRLDSSKVAAGGALNAVLHGVQDIVAAKPDVVPEMAKPLLLGYDGFGDFVTINQASRAGVHGFIDARNMANARGMRGLANAENGRFDGRVFG